MKHGAVEQESMLEEVLDYMDACFDGDLTTTAVSAVEYAGTNELIFGPLWDEIGVQVLKQIYRVRRIARSKGQIRKTADPVVEDREGMAKAMWYNIDGRYYNLFDLVKKEVEEIAEYYAGQAASYAFEETFLLKVANNLKKNQKVGDVFDLEGLRELRKKV